METERGPFNGLMDSWTIALEAERKAARTVGNYTETVRMFTTWLTENDHPHTDVRDISPDLIRAWLAHLAATRSDQTCRTRYAGLRQFFRWCALEGEVDTDPMATITQPKVVHQPKPVLRPDDLRALLRDCDGPGFADLRDRALVLLFGDTGCRLSGLAGLRESDVNLRERVCTVTLKGGRRLVLPFGATAAKALDRYLRAKRRMAYGGHDWLWLSSNNKGRLTANGMYQMLQRRGARAGVHVHPHLFRHTFADAWLRAGGGETDLMELMGWTSRQMVGHYAASSRAERAREAHRRLSPMDAL